MPDNEELKFFRSPLVTTLLNAVVFNAATTNQNSAQVDVEPYRRFTLYLQVDSTLAPTTIQFLVQFSPDGGTTWHTYKQGLFASLFYEDTDVASTVYECFSGECAGRLFRLRAVAVGTDATNLFTVTAKAEFFR